MLIWFLLEIYLSHQNIIYVGITKSKLNETCFVGSISVSSIKCHLAWGKFESKSAEAKNKYQNDEWGKWTRKW